MISVLDHSLWEIIDFGKEPALWGYPDLLDT